MKKIKSQEALEIIVKEFQKLLRKYYTGRKLKSKLCFFKRYCEFKLNPLHKPYIDDKDLFYLSIKGFLRRTEKQFGVGEETLIAEDLFNLFFIEKNESKFFIWWNKYGSFINSIIALMGLFIGIIGILI